MATYFTALLHREFGIVIDRLKEKEAITSLTKKLERHQ